MFDAILHIPILQALGVIVLWALAVRLGLPVNEIVSRLLKLNGHGSGHNEMKADTRNALQPLYLKMDELSQYANHDTTSKLNEIVDTQKNQCKKLDKIEGHLEIIRIEGVRLKK